MELWVPSHAYCNAEACGAPISPGLGGTAVGLAGSEEHGEVGLGRQDWQAGATVVLLTANVLVILQ